MITRTLQLLALCLCIAAPEFSIKAQTIIGGVNRDPSAVLELSSQDKGFLLPRLSKEERDQIPNPATGLMIFNTTATCVDVNVGAPTAPIWRCLTAPAGIGGLHCEAAVNTGVLTIGQPASNISSQVPYSGGLGDPYASHIANSTGVAGLTATLLGGNFAYGSGSVDYQITGIPSAAGIAKFSLVVGNQHCILSREILPVGEITALACSDVQQNGALYASTGATGVTCVIPYTGGNGGTYFGQTIFSTGVEGLVATLAFGILNGGAGQLVFTISGTPNCVGSAYFNISIGGQTCTFTVEVEAQSPYIADLQCLQPSHTGVLIASQSANDVSFSINYSGGNGVAYPDLEVVSTGVTGLIAIISADTLACGEDSLRFDITGTPACSGTVSFTFSIGGQTCTVTREVQSSVGIITNLLCDEYVASGLVSSGFSTEGVNINIPYVGGNGGSYDALSVNSIGLSSLSLSINNGVLNCEAGVLTFGLSGIPEEVDNVLFNLQIGGQACTLNIRINDCGAFIGGGEWKKFMCHNLGANSDANPVVPSWELVGHYFQWGRNPDCFGRDQDSPCMGDVYGASAPWSNTENTDNDGSIMGWSDEYASNGSWIDYQKTATDPCPSGYRVPAKQEWDGVINNELNPQVRVGSWAVNTTNYTSGYKFGSYLFLPTTGYRDYTDGQLYLRGSHGYYWSSTEREEIFAWLMYFRENIAQTDFNSNRRTYGIPVRCIAE